MTGVMPHTGRPDWWIISAEQAQSIGHSPGLQFDEKLGAWIAHRSQLPLLGTTAREARRSVRRNVAAVTPPSDVGTRPPTTPDDLRHSAPVFGDGATTLRPHQVEAVEFMSDRHGIFQCDAMRVGKTGSCIGTHDPDSGPMVVIGPLATRRVWVDWFKRRWPDEQPVVLSGIDYRPEAVNDAKLVFAHYDVLVHWASLGLRRRVGTLVFDEGHKLSKRKSRRSQGAAILAPMADKVIMATGTPLWNKPEGLWSMLNITNPAAWGTYSDFTKRYCGGHPGSHGWKTGDATNVAEFKHRLGEIMIRRVWAELSDDLVPTERSLERVAVPDSKVRELDMIAAVLSDQTLNRQTLIGQMARYRRLVGALKGARAAEMAAEQVKHGPVVIWVWHKSVAEKIDDVLPHEIPRWIITGKVPENKREDILDEWRGCNDGVLVMSLSIGQAGIDLSHAAQCIFAELDWTPAVIGQAEMRTFSPLRGDWVDYVAADHDIDMRLAKCLHAKCDQALLLGTPAADTAIDMIGQMLGNDVPEVADLDGLAAKLIKRVQQEGTTFL